MAASLLATCAAPRTPVEIERSFRDAPPPGVRHFVTSLGPRAGRELAILDAGLPGDWSFRVSLHAQTRGRYAPELRGVATMRDELVLGLEVNGRDPGDRSWTSQSRWDEMDFDVILRWSALNLEPGPVPITVRCPSGELFARSIALVPVP